MKLSVSIARLLFLVLPGATALGVLSTVPAGQIDREAKAATLRQLVTGRVFMPDGSPTVGAEVVTSAGGQAVTGVDGRFALTVDLPLDVESVEVTAVADETTDAGSMVASARFVPAALSPTTHVGQLALALSPNCLLPRWLPTFGGRPGVGEDGEILALAVFDDGTGPALFAGGSFPDAGGVSAKGIAKWNGNRWSALGSGVVSLFTPVWALAAHDDGSGPALYAGGAFTAVGGVSARRIARWDGSSWSALGNGMNGGVNSLTVFDDGSGPALYAGGSFTSAGGVPANSIAKWDGSSWSALGSGMNGGVDSLTVFDDGSGLALYAGGSFTSAGGVPANSIAKWDGSSWSALGNGLVGGAFISAAALAVYDDGSGSALYAGGWFTTAGGVAASRIAKWDGSSWSTLGSGMDDAVLALAVYDDGSGPALFAGGAFTTAGGVPNRIARWDGSSWSGLGSGLSSEKVDALAVYDDGDGPALFAGGIIYEGHIRKWDGSNWSAVGSGPVGGVGALYVYDDGGGPALYAGGGSFPTAGGVLVHRIAKWDGSSWSALGSGLSGGGVSALTVYDDGGGPALVAGGWFTAAGGASANRIARWDGTTWSALGSGISGGSTPQIWALAVYDDGTGLALYAGGSFTSAGGVTASGIARWNGTTWSALGSGLNGEVLALTVHDDGTGLALYAGGSFTIAGGVSANRIARWDGSTWSALGNGLNGGVNGGVLALTGYDDGTGPALYAGGNFTIAGGVSANSIARWDGSSWSALGSVLVSVRSLIVRDSGSGPELYAGASYPANRVSKWDGSNWAGLGLQADDGTSVLDLEIWDDGDGPALYAGGDFAVSRAGDSYLAKWGCRTKPGVKRHKL